MIYVERNKLDQESDHENKKTRTLPRKRSRKQELDQESNQEKKKKNLFFLITFLVEIFFFFFSYFLVFFYKFPPLDSLDKSGHKDRNIELHTTTTASLLFHV